MDETSALSGFTFAHRKGVRVSKRFSGVKVRKVGAYRSRGGETHGYLQITMSADVIEWLGWNNRMRATIGFDRENRIMAVVRSKDPKDSWKISLTGPSQKISFEERRARYVHYMRVGMFALPDDIRKVIDGLLESGELVRTKATLKPVSDGFAFSLVD